MKIHKQYARRQVDAYHSPYADPFRYVSLAKTGESLFVAALAEVNKSSLSRDIKTGDPQAEFKSLKEFAGSAFDPQYWEIAYVETEIAGIVCAQRYFDKPEEGSLFHLGVVEKFRGKGYGKILHAHGLELLARQAISSYVGSTDVLNKPMIGIFVKNGCALTQIL